MDEESVDRNETMVERPFYLVRGGADRPSGINLLDLREEFSRYVGVFRNEKPLRRESGRNIPLRSYRSSNRC